MSRKHRSLESNQTQNIQSSSFELSELRSKAQIAHHNDGFALWMLNPSLWLPTTLNEFARFLVFMVVLVLGSTVNIYISAQISEAELNQARLKEEYLTIQRQNAQITWQIAEYTSLDQIRQRAVNIGYIGAPSRSYAISPISDDALAILDATILPSNSAGQQAGRTAQESIESQQLLAEEKRLDNLRSGASQRGQEAVLAANISANQLIENGLLEAIRVIDGR